MNLKYALTMFFEISRFLRFRLDQIKVELTLGPVLASNTYMCSDKRSIHFQRSVLRFRESCRYLNPLLTLLDLKARPRLYSRHEILNVSWARVPEMFKGSINKSVK